MCPMLTLGAHDEMVASEAVRAIVSELPNYGISDTVVT